MSARIFAKIFILSGVISFTGLLPAATELSVERLEDAREWFNEDHCQAFAVNLTAAEKTNSDRMDLFDNRLALVDQARLAICYEVFGFENLYQRMETTPESLHVIDQAISTARFSGDLASRAALQIAKYKLLQQLNPKAENLKDTYLEAVDQALSAGLPKIARHLLLSQQQNSQFLSTKNDQVQLQLNLAASYNIYRMPTMLSDAAKHLESAIELFDDSVTITDLPKLNLMLADTLFKTHNFQDSIEPLIYVHQNSMDPREIADASFLLGKAYLNQYIYKDAIPPLRAAFEFYQSHFEDSPSLGKQLVLTDYKLALANALRGDNQSDEAIELYGNVIDTRRKIVGMSNESTIEAYSEMLKQRFRLGQYEQADETLKFIQAHGINLMHISKP